MTVSPPYSGSCHCGNMRFTVTIPPLESVLECNCSICTKLGGLWTFAPASAFTLTVGEAGAGEYQFGKKRLRHQHCQRCGIETHASGTAPDGTATVGINVRCFDEIDLATLTRKPWDGRST